MRRAPRERADILRIEDRESVDRVNAETRVEDLHKAHARQDLDLHIGACRQLAQQDDRALCHERAAGHRIDEIPHLAGTLHQVVGNRSIERFKIRCFLVKIIIRRKGQSLFLKRCHRGVNARAQDEMLRLLHELPGFHGNESGAARAEPDNRYL